MLKKEFIRDGRNQAIGSITSGFANGGKVARDLNGKILGRASGKFHETRQSNGRLISTNTADPNLLIRK